MKILVISDTHGQNEIVDILYKKHPNMDAYLHAGDCCSDPSVLSPFVVVRGNCDYYFDSNERIILDTPYGKLLMQHVPNISYSTLKKENIKIFVHGHTHERRFQNIEGIYYVCPGSTSRERDQYSNGYCILNIEKNSVSATFFDID